MSKRRKMSKVKGRIGMHEKGVYEKYIKRPQDMLCALLALIVLSPILLITAFLVRVKLGSPVIFKQERPGLNGKIFTLYKFRTMTDERDSEGNLLPDEVRLTKFGKLLRSTSLDELPELLNILFGDIAVIGPRPLLVEYLPRYNAEQRRRHEVRPGLSGLAQVNGRNAISWEDKFKYDREYLSFMLNVFKDEYKEHIKRDGIKKAFEDYIMSVPSIFRIHIADCDIRYLLRSWGAEFDEDDDEIYILYKRIIREVFFKMCEDMKVC